MSAGGEWSEEGEEIIDAPIVNPENEQNLLVDCVWSPVTYQKSDEFVRQLLVTTDRYYNWTSERRRMIDQLFDDMDDYDSELEVFSGIDDNDLEDDEKQERNQHLELLRETFVRRKKDWEETCSEYKDPEGWEEFNTNKSSFASVLQETLGCREFCALTRKVAGEFINENKED